MKHFFDCGSHLLEGLEQFSRSYCFDQSWLIDSFEANPYTYRRAIQAQPLLGFEYRLLNQAVWIADGQIEVNIDPSDRTSDASNILSVPPAADPEWGTIFDWREKCVVPAVNFSRLVLESSASFIAVKLDIEGAEFAVLQSLIGSKALSRVDHLYVEFHERFFGYERPRYRALRDTLITIARRNTRKFERWD